MGPCLYVCSVTDSVMAVLPIVDRANHHHPGSCGLETFPSGQPHIYNFLFHKCKDDFSCFNDLSLPSLVIHIIQHYWWCFLRFPDNVFMGFLFWFFFGSQRTCIHSPSPSPVFLQQHHFVLQASQWVDFFHLAFNEGIILLNLQLQSVLWFRVRENLGSSVLGPQVLLYRQDGVFRVQAHSEIFHISKVKLTLWPGLRTNNIFCLYSNVEVCFEI